MRWGERFGIRWSREGFVLKISYTDLIRGLIGERKSIEACRYLKEMLDKGMKTPLNDYKKLLIFIEEDRDI